MMPVQQTQPTAPSKASVPPPLPARPVATLSQKIAFTMAYERMVKVFLFAPSLVVAFPVLVMVVNLLTKNMGLACLVLAVVFFLLLGQLVAALVATPEAYAKQMQAKETVYAWQAFLFAGIFTRVFLFPMLEYSGYPDTLVWEPHLSFFFQCAVAVCVPQASVLLRYVGRKSIMRCSPFPLVSNPLESYVRSLVRDPSTASTARAPQRRRFLHPAAGSVIVQMFIATLAGVLVWGFLIKSLFDPNDSFANYASCLGCICTTLLPILLFIRGEKHELDPEQYLNKGLDNFSIGILPSFFWSSASLVLSCTLTYCFLVEELPHHWVGTVFHLFQCLSVLALAVSAFDEFLKRALFFEPDFDETVQVTLACLLSPSIAQKVCVTNIKKNEGDARSLQAKECENLVVLGEKFGEHMTNQVDEYVECPFEEDILKFSLLYSIGGGKESANEAPSRAIPKRQRQNLQKYIDSNRSTGRHFDGEPDVVVLVRGLCVYVGGLGETLHVKQHFLNSDESWKIPPGMIVNATNAVKAIKRCYTLLTYKDKATSMLLSALVAAVVTSLFHLRNGICSYEFNSNPRLLNLVMEINSAAAALINTQQRELPVARIVLEWLDKEAK